LFVTGGLAVLYVASTLLHAGFYQEIANNTLDQQIHAEEQQEVSMPPAAANEGDVLGRIEIPRLAVRVAILEGTTP
jgi:sortase (surface protein transpeptidase)